jgi:hypothetical protein
MTKMGEGEEAYGGEEKESEVKWEQRHRDITSQVTDTETCGYQRFQAEPDLTLIKTFCAWGTFVGNKKVEVMESWLLERVAEERKR